MMMPRIAVLRVAAAVLVLALAAPGRGIAQQTFDACYVPDVGAIYLINQTGLPSACLSNTHVAISWTAGGELADGSVTAVKLADGAVITIKLADGAVTETKLAFDPATQAELDALGVGGTINTSTNPVDWTKLKGVPADFADGVDDGGGATSDVVCSGCVETTDLADAAVTAAKLGPDASSAIDHGAVSGLGDDDHAQYLLVEGTRTGIDGFAVTGTLNSGAIPVEGAGVRLMWYPGKAAVRAGEATGSRWNDGNVGGHSMAFGWNTTASGTASLATGNITTASANFSTAMGSSTSAEATSSTAMGDHTTASGIFSTAMGNNTTASGASSMSMGASTAATGTASTAMGASTTADGNWSTAMGNGTAASANYSTAMGSSTQATGSHSTAMGLGTTAKAFGSLVLGRYNFVDGDPDAWVDSDPVLVVGNGTASDNRSDALWLRKNGNLTIAGTLTEFSDIRLKEDVEPVESTLDGVLQLTPIRYRFRDGTGHPTERQIGLSAQEVEGLFPELVKRDSQGYLSVAYTDLAAVLVRAIQEQQARMDAQDKVIAALRAEIAAQRADRAESAREQ